MKTNTSFRKITEHRSAIVIVGIFVVIGVVLLSVSKAATPFVTGETESGTVAGCASRVTDATASGGTAVQFGCASGSTNSLGLDESGATVPDTNYAIPSGALFVATTGNDSNAGTQAAPYKTITKAINAVPNNGTIVVRGGLYRDGYRSSDGSTYGIQNKTMTIQAYPHEQAWFDGTDVQDAASWTSDGSGHWYKSWNTPSFCENKYYTAAYNAQPTNNSGPCSHYDMYGDPSNPAAGDPQMAFIDGAYVHEVTSLSAATPGNFFYDWTNKRIYISTNPSGHTVELATRPTFLVMGGTATVNVKILGLGFTRFATNEYSNQTSAAITIYGTNTLIENSVFTKMAGQATSIGSVGGTVRHSVFAFNGFNGTGSNGRSKTAGTPYDGVLIENSVYNNNNTELFGTGCSASCAQAGIKIAHMNGFTIRNNIIENNNGIGAWCDEACTGGVFVNNFFKNNKRGAIIYEISSGGIIASNMIIDSSGAPALRNCSSDTKIYNNTIINSQTTASIWVYDDPRYIAKDGAGEVGPDTRNVSVANNVISGTVEGFRAQGTDTTGSNTPPSQFFSLVDYNSYYRPNGTGQVLWSWYAPGAGRVAYTSLSAVTAAYGFEAHGQDIATGGDPFFTNPGAGDYTIRSNSVAYHAAMTIPADVAAAIGITQATGQSRGALMYPSLK